MHPVGPEVEAQLLGRGLGAGGGRQEDGAGRAREEGADLSRGTCQEGAEAGAGGLARCRADDDRAGRASGANVMGADGEEEAVAASGGGGGGGARGRAERAGDHQELGGEGGEGGRVEL